MKYTFLGLWANNPILNNTLHALVERKNATLLDIPRLLTDRAFQEEIISKTSDPQTRDFFKNEYPAYQKGAHLPITSRLGVTRGTVR